MPRLAAVVAIVPLILSASTGPAAAEDSITLDLHPTTVHLTCDGRRLASATESFLGSRVVSPGDVVSRSMVVSNDATTPGVLTIRPVFARAPEADGAFGRAVRVDWRLGERRGTARLSDLTNGTPFAEKVSMPAGSSQPFRLTVRMPTEEVSGARNGEQADLYAFDIQFLLTGTAGSEAADDSAPVQHLIRTGPAVASAVWWLVAAAALAGLLLLKRRRREEPDEPEPAPVARERS